MPIFAARIPRLAIVICALAAFALIPPEVLARGPKLCVWRHLFHIANCPACGTLRSLSALFHGRVAEALDLNRNVVLTAPGLLWLMLIDLQQSLRKLFSW